MSRRRIGRSSSVLERGLHHHVEEYWQSNNKPTTDQLVEKLRAAFPEYARQKLQPFRKRVQEIRQIIKNTSAEHNRLSERDNGCTPSDGPPRKKTKKMDRGEERLLDLENKHILRNQDWQPISSSSSDSVSASSDKEGDSSVFTSDDTVYEERVEPGFDLMKSMLRDSYSGSKNSVKPMSVEKENVKSEDVYTKDSGKDVPAKEKVKRLNNDDGEEKGKRHGPMFKDLGGMTKVLDRIYSEVIFPLCHPELLNRLGVGSIRGMLLHGPPGCGKTKLSHAIANEMGIPLYNIVATELVSGVSGESEKNIRELFSKAYRTAPSIVFIDEIDAIASKRENLQREMDRRIVTQLMTCMDESHKPDEAKNATSDGRPCHVIVIGATNRPDAVDPALRRPGRFDIEIALGVPDENVRLEILTVITQNLRLDGGFDLVKIANATSGFVGADLAALVTYAGVVTMKRIRNQRINELSTYHIAKDQLEVWLKKPWSNEEMQNLSITMADFEEAVEMVQPSSLREGFSTRPNVTWDDVGGHHLLRKKLDFHIIRRIKNPKYFERIGKSMGTGFLLHGPPGCGKTLIASIVANEAGASFMYIKGPEILTKYVGDSELAVRTIFSRARTCSPCIIFFDEVDALTTKRGTEGGLVVERVLTQLLTELDGAEKRKGVYVIGATNRLDAIDKALLRPGRLGTLFYVPLPDPDERGQILKTLARDLPIDPDVDLVSIGRSEASANLSGDDLKSLIGKAAMAAHIDQFESIDETPLIIKGSHFEQALRETSPSVSKKEKRYYDNLAKRFGSA